MQVSYVTFNCDSYRVTMEQGAETDEHYLSRFYLGYLKLSRMREKNPNDIIMIKTDAKGMRARELEVIVNKGIVASEKIFESLGYSIVSKKEVEAGLYTIVDDLSKEVHHHYVLKGEGIC